MAFIDKAHYINLLINEHYEMQHKCHVVKQPNIVNANHEKWYYFPTSSIIRKWWNKTLDRNYIREKEMIITFTTKKKLFKSFKNHFNSFLLILLEYLDFEYIHTFNIYSIGTRLRYQFEFEILNGNEHHTHKKWT